MLTAAAQSERSSSRYEAIRDALREAIRSERATTGLVLVEAPLAQLFGTSRVPVRQALTLLHEEGLIRRFEGRGYLVDPDDLNPAPNRLPLTLDILGLDAEEQLIDNRPLSEKVYDELASTVSRFMAFGHYRLDEQLIASEMSVSRTLVREALMRLRDRGLVEKEPYSNWLAGPITAKAVREDYDLRAVLEPDALKRGAPCLAREDLMPMLDRIARAQQAGDTVTHHQIAAIETDLHTTCLAGAGNDRMAAVIRQAQNPMAIGRILHEALGKSTDDAMLNEHRLVIEALLYGNHDSAALLLRDHLLRAKDRSLQRLKVLSVLPQPESPAYLERIA